MAPEAAAWPPPPSRAHTLLALRTPGSVRRDSLHVPGLSSRMVIAFFTPSTCPTKEAISSRSRSSAPNWATIARSTAATAVSPPSNSSMPSTIRLSIRRRFRVLVRKWRLFSSAAGMPVSIRAAAVRWVSAVVFP